MNRVLTSLHLRLPDTYEIPTVYGGVYGPDLNRVAEITGLSSGEVIDLYSSTTFTIYFLGFLCAQPYLGGLPVKLKVPRLDNPRLHMPAGSVGIGGIQASLLTIDQPSGHNFIGRTFLSLYDPTKIPPTPLRAGDRIIFKPISEDEIPEIRGKLPVVLAWSGGAMENRPPDSHRIFLLRVLSGSTSPCLLGRVGGEK